MKWSTAGAALFGAAVLCAAPAAADSTDDAFMGALTKAGIVMPDRDSAIAMGHSMCAAFDRNEKSSALAIGLTKTTDLSLKQSSFFVGLSISAYCPQYAGHTDDSLQWLNPRPPLM